MHLVVGLGNPGTEYQTTRHNVGFLALDYFASQEIAGETFSFEKKFNAHILNTLFVTEKIILAQPQTFMNNSGFSVAAIASYFSIPTENILVIYDEVDLPFGEIRATGTSSGGHKGMQSIIDHLGTNEINRLRIGVANDTLEQIDTADFVLSKFSKEELQILEQEVLPAVSEKIKQLVS